MFRTRAIVILVTLPAIAGLAAGCADDNKATPQVIFEGLIDPGQDNNCLDAAEFFTIGSFGNQAADPKEPSRSIQDGEKGFPEPYDQGTVSVGCSVTPAGADEFNVQASVDLGGATGGFFRIDGKFKTSGEQTGIHAQFSSRKTANIYEQKADKDGGCIVRYTTGFMGVAAGRVWGEIECPHAGQLNAPERSCAPTAQFRFENCAQ